MYSHFIFKNIAFRLLVHRCEIGHAEEYIRNAVRPNTHKTQHTKPADNKGHTTQNDYITNTINKYYC
jgi:hypothetical protein